MKKKIRVNITVDEELLEKAKQKLELFGGKMSTLFNVYLSDFVKSIEKNSPNETKKLQSKIKDLEDRIKKLEKK